MKTALNRTVSGLLALVTLLSSYSSAHAQRNGPSASASPLWAASAAAPFSMYLAPGSSSGWAMETSGTVESITAVSDGWVCQAGGQSAASHYARFKFKAPEQAGMVLSTFYMKLVLDLPADFYTRQKVGFRIMNTDNYPATLNGTTLGAKDANESRTSVYINSNHSLRVVVDHETVSSKTLYASATPLPVGIHAVELFGSLNAVAPWYLRVDGVVVASGVDMLTMNDTLPGERVATRFVAGIDGAAGLDASSMNLKVKSFQVANYDVASITTGTPRPTIMDFSAGFGSNGGWTVSDHVRTVGDVNGDGLADLVGFGGAGVYVALSTGSGFGPISQWTKDFGTTQKWTTTQHVRTVGDVNGDGLADLVGFGGPGVYVALSTGSGFLPLSLWSRDFGSAQNWTVSNHVRTVGDVNGDGLADLVGLGGPGVYVALSTGGGFGPLTQWSKDFGSAQNWTTTKHVRTVGDVNGDGLADLVGFGGPGVYVALSTGSGFGPLGLWSQDFGSSQNWSVSEHVRTVGDVNGDGLADLVGFGGPGVYVALSTGGSFGPLTLKVKALGSAQDWSVSRHVRTVGDWNGDGAVNLIGFGSANVSVVQ